MQRRRNKIIMLGPALESQGGISSVAQVLMKSDLTQLNEVKYISTTIDSNKFRKLYRCIHSYIEYASLIDYYDLIHAHFSYGISMLRKKAFILLAKIKKKKIIIHCHSSEIERLIRNSNQKEINRLKSFIERSDAVIVMSKYWRDMFENELGVKSKKLYVIPNGIVQSQESVVNYSIRKQRSELSILYVGRVEHDKGIDILIDGVSKANQLMEDSELSITVAGVGNEDLLRDYKIMAANRKVKCDFCGWVDSEKKIALYEHSDMFVLPSRREVFPMSLLEAMNAGLACIASDCGSIPEMLEDSGLTFKCGDSDSLASCLMELASDSYMREMLGNSAKNKVSEQYTVKMVACQLDKVYKTVLNG